MSNNYMNLHDPPWDKTTVPQINSKSINMLWHEDWFDGPVNGVMEYEGAQFWFELFDISDDHLGFQYAVIPLTHEELQIVKAADEEWKRGIETFRPNFNSPEAKSFFDEQDANYEQTHPFRKRERITAWFCERGTTSQQFAQIKVSDEAGKLIQPQWDQNDPRSNQP